MARLVKCRYCGKSLPIEDAYCYIRDYTNYQGQPRQERIFFCNEDESIKETKRVALHQKTYELCADILDEHFSKVSVMTMLHGVAYKHEWGVVFNYLYEKQDYLYRLLKKKDFVSLQGKLKYLKAVILNDIDEYAKKLDMEDIKKVVKNIDEIETCVPHKSSKKRRGFSEIEAEIEEYDFI